jgi:hypothetical protein
LARQAECDEAKLLVTFLPYDGKTVCLFLEVIANHAYEKSRFLRGATVDCATEAGIAHCSPHGLRKAGASIAAEMGASEVELDAMYGWSNPRQSGT